jgi:hypothetical protein
MTLSVSGRSSCVVFTPNGIAGSAIVRAPAAVHRSATRAATVRARIVSVP